MKRTIPFFALLFASFSYADTDDNYGTAMLIERGITCGDWVDSKGTPSRDRRIAWIFGYITGLNNVDTSRQVIDMSATTVELYVDKYCRDNPLATYPIAAHSLFEEAAHTPPEQYIIR